VPDHLVAMIDSFELHLRALPSSDKTVTTYTDAVRWLAGSLPPDIKGWSRVTHVHLRAFFAELGGRGYAKGYVNNIGRALQAFDKWYAAEEGRPRLFGEKLKVPSPPKPGDRPPPVVAVEQLATLIRDAEKGRSFEDRRDAALLRLFACTGCRLAELANVAVDDLGDLAKRELTVTGKAGKVRTVKYDHKAARALDRYMRSRAEHRHAYLSALWIGVRRAQGMTTSGVYQIVERRGRRLGLQLHPHLFRHTFVDRWLDAGGAEGDLMELMGWDSPQMLRWYGRSAKAARARRAYDRVDVMGGV